jgi:SWI/SNF-related matrix-associated actin-dependent regulator 1 of chromatin subfamily A
MKGMLIDGWIPKSVIKSVDGCDETVTLPAEHKMSVKERESKPKVERRAILVKFKSSGEIGLRITFPFDRRDLEHVKMLEGRKFVADQKYWTCPLTIENAKLLREWKFDVDERVDEYLDRAKIKMTDIDSSNLEITGLGMDLYPYQRDGVAFTEAKNGRVLIADEMGLGKTAQALAWLQLRTEVRPVVIVVPASLKLNWERETFMWMEDPTVQILSGKSPYELTAEIIIINYDILAAWLLALIAYEPKVVIADEVHYAKNNGAKRTKALKQLAKKAEHFIGLSGTPIVNRPIEFYNAIKMIDPNLFPDYWRYAKRYCNARPYGS